MTRVDLYGAVHKGLRATLFRTLEHVARTDFTCAGEAAAAAASVSRLLAFLAEHAEHEDHAILPLLRTAAVELHADLASEHARVEGLGADVGRLAARLTAAVPAERVAVGLRLSERLGRLVAEQLQHMAREESQANRALWAHCSDDELRAAEQRIVGSIAPPRMAQWLEIMLPALSRPERAGMLAGMRAEMPAEVYAELTAGARAALGPDEWARSEGAVLAAAHGTGGAA